MKQADWDRRYSGDELVWSSGPNRFLAAEVEGLEPATGLDVACGEGRNALWLAEQGWRMIGVDFSQVAIDKAKAIGAARGVAVSWEVADVRTWRCPISVELAIMFYLHQPWEMMAPTIANTAAAVEPGGTILVVGHDLENLERGHGGPPSANVLYTPDRIAAALDGFDIVKAERVDREVPSANAVAIDNLVRAVKR